MPTFLQLGDTWINLDHVLWVEEKPDDQGGTRLVMANSGTTLTRNVSPAHVPALKRALAHYGVTGIRPTRAAAAPR